MLRLLLLQQWYGLSEVEVCEAASNRPSFRKFWGLARDESTPDDTALCRFRTGLVRAELADTLMREINRQLGARGLILRHGSFVDATLIAAAVAPPSTRGSEVTDRHPQARLVARKGQLLYAYKAHVAGNARHSGFRQFDGG